MPGDAKKLAIIMEKWGEEIKFRRLMQLCKNVRIGKTNASPLRMHFGAKVWIFMPFLGVYALFGRLGLGETAARKQGMHFVDFYVFLDFLGKVAALKKDVH